MPLDEPPGGDGEFGGIRSGSRDRFHMALAGHVGAGAINGVQEKDPLYICLRAEDEVGFARRQAGADAAALSAAC